MPELPVPLLTALGGLAVGLVIGVSGRLTRLCTFCAVNDLVRHGDAARLKSWGLAVAVAMIGVQGLAAAGLELIFEPLNPQMVPECCEWKPLPL